VAGGWLLAAGRQPLVAATNHQPPFSSIVVLNPDLVCPSYLFAVSLPLTTIHFAIELEWVLLGFGEPNTVFMINQMGVWAKIMELLICAYYTPSILILFVDLKLSPLYCT